MGTVWGFKLFINSDSSVNLATWHWNKLYLLTGSNTNGSESCPVEGIFMCRMLAVMENRAKLVVNVVHEVVTNINAEKLVKIH